MLSKWSILVEKLFLSSLWVLRKLWWKGLCLFSFLEILPSFNKWKTKQVNYFEWAYSFSSMSLFWFNNLLPMIFLISVRWDCLSKSSLFSIIQFAKKSHKDYLTFNKMCLIFVYNAPGMKTRVYIWEYRCKISQTENLLFWV